MNVNTLDEVPDSSWFTNRIGARQSPSADEVRRGPDTSTGPAAGRARSISGKSDGITPGFTIRDAAGNIWFVKFDPPSNPEMATGAEMVVDQAVLGPRVPRAGEPPGNAPARPAPHRSQGDHRDIRGQRRPLTEGDLDRLLAQGRAPRPTAPTASWPARRWRDGPWARSATVGTRPDDPNDIHPHQHRRELRGLRVFAAWLNHDDSRSINSLDTLVRAGRTPDRLAPPDRLRLHARQRQHLRAEAARRQRVHLGGAAHRSSPRSRSDCGCARGFA